MSRSMFDKFHKACPNLNWSSDYADVKDLYKEVEQLENHIEAINDAKQLMTSRGFDISKSMKRTQTQLSSRHRKLKARLTSMITDAMLKLGSPGTVDKDIK